LPQVERVREKLVDLKVSGMVVTELDEIAWLFNIRGEGDPQKNNTIISEGKRHDVDIG
jgi:hypothetical protein